MITYLSSKAVAGGYQMIFDGIFTTEQAINKQLVELGLAEREADTKYMEYSSFKIAETITILVSEAEMVQLRLSGMKTLSEVVMGVTIR